VDPVRCELLSLLTGNLAGNSADSNAAAERPDRANSNQFQQIGYALADYLAAI
jgi:hypothetical protein